MNNFKPSIQDSHLNKRILIPISPKQQIQASGSNPKIQWLESPEIKYFEKFDQANKLMNIRELKQKKKKILKRVKQTSNHKERIQLKGFRKTIQPQVLEIKNLKLQSINYWHHYNCFSYLHLSHITF